MTGARGESIIRNGEIEYRVLLTNRALADAEIAIGKSTFVLARGFISGATGIGDTAQLLAVGLEAARRDAKAGGRTHTLVDAYRIMDEVGFTTAARAVMEAVGAILKFSGDEDHGEDPKVTTESLPTSG